MCPEHGPVGVEADRESHTEVTPRIDAREQDRGVRAPADEELEDFEIEDDVEDDAEEDDEDDGDDVAEDED